MSSRSAQGAVKSVWVAERVVRVAGMVLVAIFAVVCVRTAFVCDDSFISFRTADNFLSGHGLRWNVAERVQVFTNPLWLFLVTAAYAVVGDVYFAAIGLSIGISVAAFAALVLGVARSPEMGLLAGAILISSRAFVDFSSSGLENPLTHGLFALLALVAYRRTDRGQPSLQVASLLACALALNRLDTLPITAPVLVALALRSGDLTRAVRAVVVGFLPLALWECFSIVYYGFPFPNTVYAKLFETGVPAGALAAHGLLYLRDSFERDPVTLVAIACAASLPFVSRDRGLLPLAIGMGLSLAYVVRVGGDFMTGRFLSPAIVCAAILLARSRWSLAGGARAGRAAFGSAFAVLLGLALLSPDPPISSGRDFEKPAATRAGIADVRGRQYQKTGLLHVWERGGLEQMDTMPVRDGLALRASAPRLVVRGGVGYVGFYAGPQVHIVDRYGLGDPLLARLPAEPDWSPAHFRRKIPRGYMRSIKESGNTIEDPAVAALYDDLRRVTRSPLWDGERWRAIWRLNLRAASRAAPPPG